jgi:hypothetical protein
MILPPMVRESASVSVITLPVASVTEPLREEVPEISKLVKKEVFGTLVPVPKAGGVSPIVLSNWSAFRLETLVVEATTSGAVPVAIVEVSCVAESVLESETAPVAERVVKTPAAGVLTLSSVQITAVG